MKRLLLATMIVAGTHVGFCLVRNDGIITAARPPKQDLRKLPTRLGEWTSEELPRDSERFPDTGAEITVTRIYRNPQTESVFLYAGVWLEYEIMPPHPPKACYTGAGHRVVSEKNVSLGGAGPTDASVRLLLLERDGQQSALLYWYQRGDRVLGNYWVRRTTWGVWGENSAPPLVKVMLEVSATDPQKAEAQLQSIAAPLLAWTQGI
jgi:EpsI family protein